VTKLVLPAMTGQLIIPPQQTATGSADARTWTERDPDWVALRADTDEWLSGYTSHRTRLTYANALGAWWDPVALDRPDRSQRVPDMLNGASWFTLCRGLGLHPYDAGRRVVVHWLELLATMPQTRGKNRGRPLSTASRANALTAVEMFYEHAVTVAERIDCTPVVINRRRAELQVPTVSPTRSLSADELNAFVDAGDQFTPLDLRPRARAVTRFMATVGCRVSEAVALNRDDFRIDVGQRIARLRVKGDHVHAVAVNDWAWSALVEYWETDRRGDRAALARVGDVGGRSAPAFYTRTGARMSRQGIDALIGHLAQIAGIEEPHTVTPHVLRHSLRDAADRAGVPLPEIQRQFGHASITTTVRYGRRRGSYAGSPSTVIGRQFADRTP
jgi:site-specific recombinase XerD